MSDDQAKYYIPKTLDAPKRWLIFTMDELGVIIAPLMIGVLFDQMFLGMVFGIIGYFVWRKYKGLNKGNMMTYMRYWYLPNYLNRYKVTAKSHNRVYLG